MKEHLRLALPNVLSNLTVPLAGLVDTILLGHESTTGPLAGVALAGAIFSFLYWGLVFLRMGTTGLTAKAVGENDSKETVGTLLRGLLIALFLGVGILLLSPLIETLSFALLQGEMQVEAQARAYYRARVWGAPAVLSLMVLNGWLLGRLMSRQVLLISIVQNVLIVALDVAFIRYLGWGAAGAGYATALAAGVSSLFAALVVWRTWGELPELSLGELFRRSKLQQLFDLNAELLVRSFFLILTLASFTNLSAWLGEVEVAANGILFQLHLFCAYFVDGYCYSLESLAGVAAGQDNWLEVRQQLRITLVLSLGTSMLFALMFYLFSSTILARMTIHTEVQELARDMLGYFLLLLILANFAYVYDGFCTGLTLGAEMRNSVVVASVLGFWPAAYLAVKMRSVDLLWVAYLVFSTLRSAYLAYRSESHLNKRSPGFAQELS